MRFAVLYDGPRPEAFGALLTGLAPLLPWAAGSSASGGATPLYGRLGGDTPRLYTPPQAVGQARDRWVDGVARWALGGAAGGSLVLVLDGDRPDAAAGIVKALASRHRSQIGAVESRSAAVLVVRGDEAAREAAVGAVAAALAEAVGESRTASVLADHPLMPWPVLVLDLDGQWDRPLSSDEGEGMAALWCLALGSRHPVVRAWEGEHLEPLVSTQVLKKWVAKRGEGAPPIFATGRLGLLLDQKWVLASAGQLRQAEERLAGRPDPSREDPREWATRMLEKVAAVGLQNSEIPITEEEGLVAALLGAGQGEEERLLVRRHGAQGMEGALASLGRDLSVLLTGWRRDLVRGAASLAALQSRLAQARTMEETLQDARRAEESRQEGRGGRMATARLEAAVGRERARRQAVGPDLSSWFPTPAAMSQAGLVAVGAVAVATALAALLPWWHYPAGWQLVGLFTGWSGAAGLAQAVEQAWWEVALEREWEVVLRAVEPALAAEWATRASSRLLLARLVWSGAVALAGGLFIWLAARQARREREGVKRDERAWRAALDGVPLQSEVVASARAALDARQAFLLGGVRMMGIAFALRSVRETLGRLQGLARTLEALGEGLEATRGRLEALGEGEPGFFSNLDPLSLARNRPAPSVRADTDLDAWERRIGDPAEIPAALDAFLAEGDPSRPGWLEEVDLGQVASLRRGGGRREEVLFAFGPESADGLGVLQAAKGGEGLGGETSVVIPRAPSALVMGLCLGLTRDEAARRT